MAEAQTQHPNFIRTQEAWDAIAEATSGHEAAPALLVLAGGDEAPLGQAVVGEDALGRGLVHAQRPAP